MKGTISVAMGIAIGGAIAIALYHLAKTRLNLGLPAQIGR